MVPLEQVVGHNVLACPGLIHLRWQDGRDDWRLYDRRYVHPI